jgi:hypothetical protein
VKLARNLFFLFAITLQGAVAQSVSLILPETGKTISLKFEAMPQNPRNFRSIRIDSEEKKVRFVPKNPIARIPESEGERISASIWNKLSGLKLHRSRFFFQGEYSTDSNPHTLLFFVSEQGASDAAPLLVLGFSEDGTPYKVLERNQFDVYRFQTTNQGDALIIGKATMSQVMYGDSRNDSKTPHATTYDPYSVFVVHGFSTAQYSLSASVKYNLAHYVWAGPHSREDYAVLYNVPGHPKVMGAPASQLETLMGSKQSSLIQ